MKIATQIDTLFYSLVRPSKMINNKLFPNFVLRIGDSVFGDVNGLPILFKLAQNFVKPARVKEGTVVLLLH